MTEPELQHAIEAVYRVFARYPHPADLRIADYRNPEKVKQGLASAPLRALGGAELGRYAGWAITTVGGPDEYRHFLPRILELALARTRWLGTAPWLIASKLNYGNWRIWPEDEQRALEGFFTAAWAATVADHFEYPDWFEAIVHLDLDMDRVLEIWLSSDSPYAMIKLCWTIEPAGEAGSRDFQLPENIWTRMRPQARIQFRAWAISAPVRKRINAALQEVAGDLEKTYWLTSGLELLEGVAPSG